MMIVYKEVSWWYWAITAGLLIAGLAGRFEAFYLAIALSVVQTVHFRLREGAFAAFPAQVRLVYTLILLAALLPPLNWLYWLPAIGTTALVLFGYCPLARILSLMPWNRRQPLSWLLVRWTFLTPPVKGSILRAELAAS
jgi:hypothetical protein